jgi:hypothetical protein
MKSNRKELVIKNLELEAFNKILMQFFFRKRSPNYPVCVDLEYFTYFNEDNGTSFEVEDFDTFNISVAPIDFFIDDWRIIARIYQSKIASQLGITILGEEEFIEDWDKVINLTEIITTMIKQYRGEIVSSDPIESVHKKLPQEKNKPEKKKKPGKIDSKNPTISAVDKKMIAEFNKLKENTKDEFRKRWAIINEYKRQNKEEFDNGVYEKPPRITAQDIIDYIYKETGEIVSDQTLYRTKHYGKLKLLD